mmetsp:Transcript_1038/g.1667  ORF Transcript_1038/g.1667 Transcript_1038/m.1667 type:complete len:93 (+) Transcript_1038:92-370(+)
MVNAMDDVGSRSRKSSIEGNTSKEFHMSVSGEVAAQLFVAKGSVTSTIKSIWGVSSPTILNFKLHESLRRGIQREQDWSIQTQARGKARSFP